MSVQQRPPHRGFTLPEILISTGILGLVLVACHTLVAFAIKWNAKMTDTVDTYQRALKASSRITYDLGAGSQATFVYDVDGFAVATARPETGPFTLDPSGSILMHRWVVYQKIGDTLYRNEVPINPPLTRNALMNPDPAPPPDFPAVQALLTGPGLPLAEDVVDFEIYGLSGGLVSLKVEGNQEDQDGNKLNSITLNSRINFRI